jgi:hypothetical protein
MKRAILALLLLWLCLTGGSSGWNSPVLLVINLLGGWGSLMIWLLLRAKQKIDPVEIGLMLYLAGQVISVGITGSRPGVVNIAVWLLYLGFFHLGQIWSDEEVHWAATMALIPYALLALLPWENSNIIAFNLLGLALLAMPAGGLWLYGSVIVLLGWALSSVGGVLAALIGLTRHARYPAILSISLIPMGWLGWWLNPIGYHWRFVFWVAAWLDFSSSPLWGVGRYQMDQIWHAHNVILTTAATTGLIGLLGLAALIWTISRRWSTLPTYAAALVLAYGAWSLVDEPLQFWGAGFMFFVALSRNLKTPKVLKTFGV